MSIAYLMPTPIANACVAIDDNTPVTMPMGDSPDKKAGAGAGPGGRHESMRIFGPEEAALVHELVEAHAPRWTYIAKLVSEKMNQPRTAASIRNYYKRFQASKKIAERDMDSKKLNRCQLCGQIKRGHVCTGKTNLAPATSNKVAKLVHEPKPAKAEVAQISPTGGLQLGGIAPLNEPPLAPAILEVVTTPGSAATPYSAAPFSITSMLASPNMALLGLLPTPTPGAALNMMGGFPEQVRVPSALAPLSANGVGDALNILSDPAIEADASREPTRPSSAMASLQSPEIVDVEVRKEM